MEEEEPQKLRQVPLSDIVTDTTGSCFCFLCEMNGQKISGVLSDIQIGVITRLNVFIQRNMPLMDRALFYQHVANYYTSEIQTKAKDLGTILPNWPASVVKAHFEEHMTIPEAEAITQLSQCKQIRKAIVENSIFKRDEVDGAVYTDLKAVETVLKLNSAINSTMYSHDPNDSWLCKRYK